MKMRLALLALSVFATAGTSLAATEPRVTLF